MRYIYRCSNCGEFEIEKSICDDSKEFCKKCNLELKKKISKPVFRLIGAGWAKDNYHKHRS